MPSTPTLGDVRKWLFGLWLCTHLLEDSGQTNTKKHKVFTVFAKSSRDVIKLRQLKDTYHLDAWREAGPAHSSGDYMVNPEHLDGFTDELKQSGISFKEAIADVAGLIRNDTFWRRRRKRARRHAEVGLDYFRYRYLSLEDIVRFLMHVRDNAQGVHVNVSSMGRSFQGRDTPYVKISTNPAVRKPILFIDAGIHGREWISPAMAVEIIHKLAFNGEARDPRVTSLLSKFDWIIVPVVNPDGYVYTYSGPRWQNRLWRKSRNVYSTARPECAGVDLNRNYGYEWNNNPTFGGSSDPCSAIYSGPHNFSEPETRNMRDLLLSNRDAIVSYISLHSFGQYLLYPWGFSSQVDLEDETDLLHVAAAFAEAMRSRNYHYNVGGTAKTLYPAAGGSDDYVRGGVGVKYAYIIELPPHITSGLGFLLPESLVRETVMDTWAGLSAFWHQLHRTITSSVATPNNATIQS